MSDDLVARFERDGFAAVPGVLDAGEVARVRAVCADYYERTGDTDMPATEFVRHPELVALPFKPMAVAALKAILGADFTYIPEFTMMTGRFGGWHRDIGDMQNAGHHADHDYRQVECAVYLQDNHPVYAGGLDVYRGSHRDPIGPPISGLPQIVRSARYRMRHRMRRPLSIPSRAGDLVIFDFRILHRASQPAATEAPVAFRKHGVFWGASSTNHHVQRYMDHMLGRSAERIYGEVARLRFPRDYPRETVEQVQKLGVHVASY